MYVKDEKGFTFLENLISFSIFLMITSYFGLLLSQLYQMETRQYGYPHEWHLFLKQLQQEMKAANHIDVYDHYITFQGDGESIRYERYSNLIRRRVNLQGHEVILQGVRESTFVKIDGGVELNMTFKTGETRIAKVYSYIENIDE
ncbi:competence type IV pilus minor pilin ComGF [Bacillus spongiae]|uniref:Competence type IV pilus minor pilin ComGF n=1 Tax=Bacillus spongiae TaxID=2683610 RepID=A0ABU8HFD7_9BACI